MNVESSPSRYPQTGTLSAIDVETYYGAIASRDSLFAPHARLVFEVIEKIGEGGMGAVYKVRDKRLGRLAALKMLSNADACKDSQTRFLREAKITARLEHPAIPSVFEAGRSAGGELYLLMRLIEGQTLSQRIDEMHDNDCPRGQVLDLVGALAKVGEAVAYAHTQGIVHRDLKPDNIMIGAFGEVLVIDWGISKDSEESELEELDLLSTMKGSKLLSDLPQELTTAGAFLGTPGYAAPEQVNSEDCDGRADVFALGIILIEILTGQSAIPGKSGAAKLIALSSGEIDMPRDVDSTLPKELDWIAFHATAIDPEERTESAEVFVSQLKSWIGGEPIAGYQYGMNERAVRVVKQRPSLMIGIVMTSILLAMTGVLGRALNEAERTSEQLDVAKVEEQKAKSEAATAKRAAELLNEAQDLVRRGSSKSALTDKIDEALELSNRGYPQLLRAAKLYEEAKATRAQRLLLEEAVKAHPPAYEALFALHLIELNSKSLGFHYTEPLIRLNKIARERGDQNEFTLFVDGTNAMLNGQLTESLALFNKAEAITNQFVWLYLNRGAVYEDLGDPKKAFDDYN
ncbi:MAG: protein kinase, partial [Planctomycetota bacterium]|nr:protein kinase [Planctomycetota bacterium]